MTIRRLVVLDHVSTAHWPGESGVHWEFLLYDVDQAVFEHHYAALLSTISWSYASVVAEAAASHQAVLDFVVTLVSNLRGSQWARGLAGDWWYLELVERSAARGEWIEQLYRITLIGRMAPRYSGVLLQLRSTQVLAALAEKPWARAGPLPRPRKRYGFSQLARNWVISFASQSLQWLTARLLRPAALRGGDMAAYTHYPDFWLSPFRAEHRERFLPTFGGPWIAWLNRPLQTVRHWRFLSRLGQEGFYPLQASLRWSDLLRQFGPAALWPRLKLLARPPRLDYRLEGIQVGPVIAEELLRSLTSRDMFQCRLIELAMRRLLDRVDLKLLIFRQEFQGFEAALLLGSDGRVRTCGFRHSTLARYLSSHRFAPGELTQERPMPDLVWTPSAAVKELMSKEGFPPERVIVCGPQRQPHLSAALPVANRDAVLLALGMRASENEVVLNAARQAVRELPIRLQVRAHPAAPSLPLRHAHLPAAPADLRRALSQSLAIVTPGSTMAFEAMYYGIMPIVFEDPKSYCYYSLGEFADSMFIVSDERQLREAIVAVLSRAPADASRRANWPQALEAGLGNLRDPLPQQLAKAIEESLWRG